MKKPRKEITAQLVRQHFHYAPETGELTWRQPRARWTPIGSRAGGFDYKGYRVVGLYGKTYRVARIAWLYMTGEWPNGEIDHKDRNPANDRWENLREASSQTNSWNRTFRNKHGVPGVSEVRGGFTARVTIEGTRQYLGLFPTAEAAGEAVIAARKAHHRAFACLETK